jgi:DNA-binding YbaB/EbfC family protein
MNMGNLQRLQQQMMAELGRIQAELKVATVDGSAGGGAVRVTATGEQKVVSITIEPSAVDPADVEMLQDLIVTAVNDAISASKALAESRMGALTGGLKLPGM